LWGKDIFVGCVKIQINVVWEAILKQRKLLFLHKSQEISFFRETLCADIECADVNLEFFFQIFWHFKICFLNSGCIYSYEQKWISGEVNHTLGWGID
jgi:hypothetical protein